MKINFTKREYRLLIDMIYLGEWVLTAHDEREDPDKQKYQMLAQKIYSFAKEMDCESLIESSKELDSYFPTREFEESGVHDYIDAYDSDSFWEELIQRLIDRDISNMGVSVEKDLRSPEAYREVASPIAERYETEFEANGLSRLKLSET